MRVANAARTFGTGWTSVVAVHGLTCTVERNDFIAISGPSGSGKSTLIHLLAGLDRPTAGSVEWPAIGSIAQLRPGPVSVVLQSPSLIPSLNSIENVALPLLLAGRERDDAINDAFAALGRLSLGDVAEVMPDDLSGGQAQRVAIARAIVGQPMLLLADEPTGQLDHATGFAVIDTLMSAAFDADAALLVTTHDRDFAAMFPIRWEMADGRLQSPSETMWS